MIALLAAAVAGASSARSTDAPPPPTTVVAVDLQRYVGLWYEIAKMPNRFQKQCARGTSAEYTLRDDGTIRVVNRCIEANGDTSAAKGLAKVVDRTSNSKLEVSFVRFLGLQLFWGDYWILDLDPDYAWAIVGHPERKYGWILSRTPQLPAETLERAFATLRDRGYDPARFEMSPP